MPVEVNGVPEEPLGPPVEAAAYFVTAEALTNVAKYAQAQRGVGRRSRVEDGRLCLEISDDGVGGADARTGSGLRGLCDRVEALDGRARRSTRRPAAARPSGPRSRCRVTERGPAAGSPPRRTSSRPPSAEPKTAPDVAPK